MTFKSKFSKLKGGRPLLPVDIQGLFFNMDATLMPLGAAPRGIDYSGAGNHTNIQSTASKQAINTASQINGKPDLEFVSASAQLYTLSGTVRDLMTRLTDHTIICVIKCATPSTAIPGHTVYGAGQGANDRTGLQVSADTIKAGYYNGTSYKTISGSFSDTNPHIITVTHASDAVPVMNIDGVAQVGVLSPALGDVAAARIGSDQTGGDRFWNGGIGQILMYNRVLTSTEIASIEFYLSVKWGITI